MRGRRGAIFDTPLCHTTLCLTPSFTPNFVTHHLSPHHLSHTTLSHTIFHTQLCHTLSFTHNFHTHTPSFTHCFVTHTHTHTIFLRHTPSFTCNFVTHNFVLLVGPPPHPLPFLLSPSPLQHLVLIVGRSCLVGLSGPLICYFQWLQPAAFATMPSRGHQLIPIHDANLVKSKTLHIGVGNFQSKSIP